jgi:hypothetical protein
MASIVSAGTTSATALNMSADTSGVLQLASNNGTVGVTMDTSQNVGIGTASPSFKMQITAPVVNGGVSVAQVITNAGTGQAGSGIGLGYGTTNGYYGVVAGQYDNTGAAITFSTSALNVAAAERMRIDSSGNVGIGQVPSVRKFEINAIPASANQLNGMRVQMGGVAASISEFLLGTDGSGVPFTSLRTGNDGNSFMTFFTGSGPTERARIDSSGNLFLGTISQINNGTFCVKQSDSRDCINTAPAVAGTYIAARFCSSVGNTVGYISVSTSDVTYATSSDYRLKHDIQPMNGALAKVAALKPVTYKWNEDNRQSQGFIAHELQEVVPECVTGEKDAVETYTDADGNEATRPVYQGIDTSFLVATLTAAIQELKAIVDAQGAEIAALKGAA